MRIIMTPISKIQRALFYMCKNQKQMQNVYIYIQKARHFVKSKTICVTFFINKILTFSLRNFYGIFEIGGGGEHFYIQKTMHFALHFYMQNNALSVTFLIQKSRHFASHFYIQKTMHFEIHFVIKNLSYSIFWYLTIKVCTPNKKCHSFCIYINANFKHFMKNFVT